MLLRKSIVCSCLVLCLSAQAPPPVDRPRVQSEQKADSAVQDQGSAGQEAHRRLPAPLKPPSLAPADHAAHKGEQGNEEGTEFWPPFLGYRVKITDSLLVLFTAVLAIVTTGLWVSTRWLWLDSREQTRIQADTREIALAALDKPHLLVTAVSHNFEQWRNGEWKGERLHLTFTFHFYNCGKVPAIIDNVVAFAFFSGGPRSLEATPYPAVSFPSPPRLHEFLGDRPSVRVFPKTPLNDINPISGKLEYAIRTGKITVLPDKESRDFSKSISDDGPDKGREEFLKNKDISPWLAGRAQYQDISGRRYSLSFCFRGDRNGSTMEMYGPPYNEHT